MDYLGLLHHYKTYAKDFFDQRYLPFDQLENAIEKLTSEFEIIIQGKSELGQAIKSINFGQGKHKILIWSQMHGNESTTTKALIDILHILSSKEYSAYKETLEKHCSIKIIPMLNPDGANVYTRLNANRVDLNRDALHKSQKETQGFFKIVEQFKPDFCFNMHGQRTIFSAGNKEFPATLSFLAPSYNKDFSINSTRISAMQLISAATDLLSSIIPNQIARYDDAFNDNCYGDYLTKQGIPTVLFEAGHFQNDYYRDQTRQYVSLSLLAMLNAIISNDYKSIQYSKYFKLPENEKRYVDVILKNIKGKEGKSLGILYKEECVDGRIVFNPIIEEMGILEHLFAHKYIDARHSTVLVNNSENFKIGDSISHLVIGNEYYTGIFIKP